VIERHNRIRGRALQAIREQHMRANPLCQACEKEGRIKVWEELDHTISLHNHGTDTDDNRQGLCKEHHRLKTAADMGHKPKATIGPDGWPK
jgi:5-methylcytosine-specific restriction protein A